MVLAGAQAVQRLSVGSCGTRSQAAVKNPSAASESVAKAEEKRKEEKDRTIMQYKFDRVKSPVGS
jgi:hypothetical protein